MLHKKNIHPKEKTQLHSRNKHRERYNFKQLIESCPELSQFVKLNKYGDESIDFFNTEAVKMLNKALLKHYYNIDNWDIPHNYLTPPIPGRADYLHHIADLLANGNNGIIPKEKNIRCLDIGVGANCIYPIIGNKEYGWSFVGSDIDAKSIESASKIIDTNESIKTVIELRFQRNTNNIFEGIIQKDEFFDLTICNPPFHASKEDADDATFRKLKNLKQKRNIKLSQNFGGQSNELWYEGGERGFVEKMILESKHFGMSCFWFSTLVSKESNLKSIYKTLEKEKALEVQTIAIGQGNKKSRILVWTFLSAEQQKKWVKIKWR